jgi:hypothetical protein
MARVAAARRAYPLTHPPTHLPFPSSHSRCKRYIPRVGVLCRLDRDGRAPLRSLASVGPYRVPGARTPRALNRCMAAGRLIPRHGRGSRRGECSVRRRRNVPARWGQRRRRVVVGCVAQKGLGRLLHRGGTQTAGGVHMGGGRAGEWAGEGCETAARRGEARRTITCAWLAIILCIWPALIIKVEKLYTTKPMGYPVSQ